MACPRSTAARMAACSSVSRARVALGVGLGAEEVQQVPGDGLAQHLHHQVHGLVAGRPHQRDVEAHVGLLELLHPDPRAAHLIERLPRLRQALRVVRPGRRRERAALELRAELHQVVDPHAVEPQQRDHGVARVRAGALGDDGARRRPGGRDQPLGLEGAQRLAHRGPADAERLRQVALGGQRVARREGARDDRLADALGHLEVQRVAADAVEDLHVPIVSLTDGLTKI